MRFRRRIARRVQGEIARRLLETNAEIAKRACRPATDSHDVRRRASKLALSESERADTERLTRREPCGIWQLMAGKRGRGTTQVVPFDRIRRASP